MSLLTDASLLLTPNANATSKLYSIIPSNGNGDFTATRATTATRINSSGLVESVALNVPRLDYSLGGCPNILLEPQRTNLALQSSSFDNASWSKSGASVTANTTTSPSGIVDADTISFSSFGFTAQIRTDNGSMTFSIYAKYIGTQWLCVENFNVSDKAGWFDLQNGVVGGTANGATSSIENIGNGWYRCIITMTATNTATSTYAFFTVNNNNSFSRTGSAYFWGAQVEAGAYATSYIPTTTASVTRNADNITRNNIFTNGWITAAGGTWFVEFRNNVPLIRQTNGGLLFTDASSNNYLNFYHPSSSSRILIAKAIGGTFSNIYTTTTNTAKIAIKWNGSTADVFVNGAKVVSATAFTATALENLSCNGASNPFNINEMALFTTPLTDAQCIALTQ